MGEVMSVSVTPFSQPILTLPRNCSVRSPLQENRCNIQCAIAPVLESLNAYSPCLTIFFASCSMAPVAFTTDAE